MTKYHSRKAMIDGIEFDSRREAQRYAELKLMERAGIISDLRTQVKYTLIPAQKKLSGGTERACTYTADFVYRDKSGSERRIRTLTNRVRVCRATLTQSR